MKKQYETIVKFGLKVKFERIKRHLSQDELSELASLNTSYISQIETAKQNTSISVIKSLADAFEITMSELLDIENI